METSELVITSAELVSAGHENLPPVIAAAGEKASRRFAEFFTANIRNRNTRLAYARAADQFFEWCEHRWLVLSDLEPVILSIVYRAPPGGPFRPDSKTALCRNSNAV